VYGGTWCVIFFMPQVADLCRLAHGEHNGDLVGKLALWKSCWKTVVKNMLKKKGGSHGLGFSC